MGGCACWSNLFFKQPSKWESLGESLLRRVSFNTGDLGISRPYGRTTRRVLEGEPGKLALSLSLSLPWRFGLWLRKEEEDEADMVERC